MTSGTEHVIVLVVGLSTSATAVHILTFPLLTNMAKAKWLAFIALAPIAGAVTWLVLASHGTAVFDDSVARLMSPGEDELS